MRALTPWRPFAQLSTLHGELDDLFSQFFGDTLNQGNLSDSGLPAVETFSRGEEFVVRADLPGVDPKNVELSVEGDRLTIRGERKFEHKEGDEGSERAYREVQYGRFERILSLPAGVDPGSVKAGYRNGVLEVTMKAPQGHVSKKVPISIH